MKLGTYVEIETAVDQVAEALDFYEKLGFQATGTGAVTDGWIVIRPVAGHQPTPTIRYLGSNTALIKRMGIAHQQHGDSLELTDPSGMHILLTPGPATAKPAARSRSCCGRFGELAIPCKNLNRAVAYWQKLGYERLHLSSDPYPWSILSDGLLIVGLHQTTMLGAPTITYVAGDIQERIQHFRDVGLALNSMQPEVNGPVINLSFTAPGGQKYAVRPAR